MNIKTSLVGLVTFLALATPVFAGGGLVEFTKAETFKNPFFALPGEAYTVTVKAHLNNANPYDSNINWCKNCPIIVKMKDPQPDDIFNPTSDKTDQNGEVIVKIVSNKPVVRTAYAEVTMPDGSVYTSSSILLNFTGHVEFYTGEGAPTGGVINPVENISQSVSPPTVTNMKSVTASTQENVPTSNPTMDQIDNLNKKVATLESKLQESQHKQGLLETELTRILSFIQRIFPFFK